MIYDSPLKILINRLRPIIAVVFITSFVINLLYFVPAVFMLQIYDRVLTSKNVNTLIALLAIAVFLYAVLAATEWARSHIMTRLGNNIDLFLSTRLFHAALDRALSNAPGTRPSDVFSDLLTIRNFLTGHSLLTILDIPWFVLAIAALYWMHPITGTIGLASSVILFSLALLSDFVSRKYVESSNMQARDAHRLLDANLQNAEVIEAMGMRDNIIQHWFPIQKKVIAYQTASNERASIVESITRFIRLTVQSGILAAAAWLAIKGDFTPGMVVVSSILLGKALAPIDRAMSTWKNFILARNAWRRLSKILEVSYYGDRNLRLVTPKGRIALSNVHVIPPGGTTAVVKGVSFEIAAGDIVGLIGPSGSGKSSLAKTIVGVWKPIIGTVRIDGADISQWNKSQLGSSIGYLPQEVGLLPGTVAFNIARAGKIIPEKVIEAAQLAGAHEMILSLPKGYNTDLNKINLSGGQKQLIALARALYGLPNVVVLDEPDAHIDGSGEVALIKTISTLKEMGKTIVIITHRPSILSVVDKLLVIIEGKIAAYGPRDVILRRPTSPQPNAEGMEPKLSVDGG